jgi:hypothetical protein
METEKSIFIEKLEKFVLPSAFNRQYPFHFMIFYTEDNNRRQIFFDTLERKHLKKYDDQIHEYGDDFDYVHPTGIRPSGCTTCFSISTVKQSSSTPTPSSGNNPSSTSWRGRFAATRIQGKSGR